MDQVPVTFAIPVVKSLSLDPEGQKSYLADFGLAPGEIYDPDRKIDIALFDRIVRASVEKSGRPDIGLVQGAMADLRQLGLIAYIMMNSSKLAEAVDCFGHYNAIVCSGVKYDFNHDRLSLRVRFSGTVHGRVLYRALMDSVLKSLQVLMAQLIGEPVPVRALNLAHTDDGSAPDYRKVFGVDPRFSQPFYEMFLDPDLLDRKISFSAPGLLARFQTIADRLLQSQPTGDVSARLRTYLVGALRGRRVGISEAARELAMSERSLQQRLSGEGTSFTRLLEEIQCGFATAELEKAEMSVSDIAFFLGYTELSSFYQAFRRWKNTTPLQYRNDARTGQSRIRV